jgi:O-antigen/teichoic acid export membrane protein
VALPSPDVSAIARPLAGHRWRDFARDGVLLFGSTLVANLANYAFHFLVSRRLPVAEYGTVTSLIAALTIAGIPSVILATIVAKYSAELTALGDLPRLRVLAERFAVTAFIVGGVIGATAAFNGARIASFLRIDDAGLLVLLGAVTVCAVLTPTIRAVLQGMHQYGTFATSTVLEVGGRAFFGVTAVELGGGVRGVLGGYLIGSLVALVYTVVAVALACGRAREKTVIDVKRLILTSGAIAATIVAQTLLAYIDVVAVKHYLQAESAGMYGAVATLGKAVLFASSFAPMLVLPRAAAIGRQRAVVFRQGLVVVGSIGLIGVMGFALLAEQILNITYGARYRAAAPLLAPYGIAMAFLAGTNLITSFAIGAHRFTFVVPLIIAAVIEVVALAFFHASLQEVVGAVVASQVLAFGAVFVATTSGRWKIKDG